MGKVVRARRPNPEFLTLPEVEHLVACAWALVDESEPENRRRAFQNALKVEVLVYTGLRVGELLRLQARDVLDSGDVVVRMDPHLKRHKPRTAAFVNGLSSSPTLAKVKAWIEERALAPTAPLWTGDYSALSWYVRKRLGPRTGAQRPVDCLNGSTFPRWRVRVHRLRAAWVTVCRRLPVREGRDPMKWEAICRLAGWDDEATAKRHYFAIDHDDARAEVRRAMGLG